MHRRAALAGPLATSLILLVASIGAPLALEASSLRLGGPGSTPDRGTPSSGPSAVGGLAAAEASLAHGAGPASARPMACSAAGGSIGCSLARAASGPSPATAGLWTNVTSLVGLGPSGRVAEMTWDASDGYVLLYGGYGCAGNCVLGDTWTFANATWKNITATVTGSPGVLLLPGLAYDPSTAKVILFGGGHNLTGVTSATWSYHAGTWTNLSSEVGSTPPGRQFPAMATDSSAGEIVMTGGESATETPLSDTWVFKQDTWTNVTSVAGASARLLAPVLSDDPPEHGVLLTGPQVGDLGRSATLVYSGGSWTNLTSTFTVEPAPMELAAAGYLPVDHAVVVFSGVEYNAQGNMTLAEETWEFEAGAWTNVTDLSGSAPATYLAPAGAVDAVSGAFILFGGETTTVPLSPWTYVLSVAPIVNATVSRAVVDVGQPVTFSAAVTGGFDPDSVSWDFADGSANVSAASAPHTYASSGLYLAKATVTSRVGDATSVVVAVYVNPVLSVNASVAGSPIAGSPTAFALGVSGGAAPYAFAWSFGDNSSSTVASPSHTYASTGTYTAIVKVTDGAGAAVNKTLSVVVGSAPSGAVSLTTGTGLGLLLGLVILVVIIVALAVLLMRKPKGPMMMAPAPPAPAASVPTPPPPPAA